MHSRERVNAALRHQPCDRVPFDFALGFSPYQLEQFRLRTGKDDPDDYFGADVRGTGIGPTRIKNDYSRYIDRAALPEHGFIDEWGQGHIPSASDNEYHSHLEGYVYPMLGLHTCQDAMDYPLPDIEAEYRYEQAARDIRRYHDQGLAVMAGMACTMRLAVMRSSSAVANSWLSTKSISSSSMLRMYQATSKIVHAMPAITARPWSW